MWYNTQIYISTRGKKEEREVPQFGLNTLLYLCKDKVGNPNPPIPSFLDHHGGVGGWDEGRGETLVASYMPILSKFGAILEFLIHASGAQMNGGQKTPCSFATSKQRKGPKPCVCLKWNNYPLKWELIFIVSLLFAMDFFVHLCPSTP